MLDETKSRNAYDHDPASPNDLRRNVMRLWAMEQASELARRGDFVAALAILTEAMADAPPTVPVLDLMARIHAQQSQFKDAEACWTQALRLDPGNSSCLAGLHRIAQLNRRPRVYQWYVWFLVFTITIAMCAWTGRRLIGQAWDRLESRMITHIQALASSRVEPSSQLNEIMTRLSAVEEQNRATAILMSSANERQAREQGVIEKNMTGISDELQTIREKLGQLDVQTITAPRQVVTHSGSLISKFPKIDLTMPGLQVIPVGESMVITFDQGLFDYRANLREGADEILHLLALRLKPAVTGLEIHIIGHTDNQPLASDSPYVNNYELGLKRAVVAGRIMAAEGLIPLQSMHFSSMGQQVPPFANNSLLNRSRNRTITLRINRTAKP